MARKKEGRKCNGKIGELSTAAEGLGSPGKVLSETRERTVVRWVNGPAACDATQGSYSPRLRTPRAHEKRPNHNSLLLLFSQFSWHT